MINSRRFSEGTGSRAQVISGDWPYKFGVKEEQSLSLIECALYTNGGRNPFTIRTYGLLDLKSFRMRTYENDGGGRGLDGARIKVAQVELTRVE